MGWDVVIELELGEVSMGVSYLVVLIFSVFLDFAPAHRVPCTVEM